MPHFLINEANPAHPRQLYMNIIRHRHLIWQFTQRQIQMEYRGRYMGAAWPLLSPLLMLIIYSYVFGFIYDGTFGVVEDESRLQHAAAILLGITIFSFFSEVLTTAPNMISMNPNFVKKVVFPLEILPISHVIYALFNAAIKFGYSAILIIFFCDQSATPFLLLPIILLPMALIAIGVSFMLSSISIYIKDISNFVGFFNMALLFSSAVFYSSNMIPEGAWALLKYNPLIHLIEWSRYALLWQVENPSSSLLYVYGFGAATCTLGLFIFNRLRDSFADVI